MGAFGTRPQPDDSEKRAERGGLVSRLSFVGRATA